MEDDIQKTNGNLNGKSSGKMNQAFLNSIRNQPVKVHPALQPHSIPGHNENYQEEFQSHIDERNKTDKRNEKTANQMLTLTKWLLCLTGVLLVVTIALLIISLK